jgi:hypothetical protein
MNPDNHISDFKDDIRNRALAKRIKHDQVYDPGLLAEINKQLKEVIALLKGLNTGDKSGDVEFVITDRDENDKIKSFKVKRS